MTLCLQPRSSSDSQPAEVSPQTGEPVITEAEVQVSPLDDTEQEVPFNEVHAQLAPAEQEEEVKEEEEAKEVEEEVKEEVKEVEEASADVSVVSEGVGQEYALSSTLPQEEKEEE